ncbi:MAG TPA: tetratricopeptide repeat protein, partial [Pyrinomonadaceae bacterium]
MAFDKVKTLRAAEKYLEMGKISSAIKEYCQIVAVDPHDFTTLNMLGDLYTRAGNASEAVSCFRRIAEHYREQGFGLKAIAMYKKIDRLLPNNIEIATYLADLYAQQDLVVEARAHYLKVVEAHTRSGAAQSALDVLRKIADLDPNNTQIRTKLADGYLKQGLKIEAASCFSEAGQSLLGREAFDDALEAFGRALEINPLDYPSLKGLLTAHRARGTADEAAEIIEQASQENPEDGELLSLLATAYVDADEPNQAERVTGLLVVNEPGAYLRFVEIARLYLRHGKIAEAVRVVTNITEQMLAEREHGQLLALIEELLAGDSDNVQALRLLVRAHWWLRDMDQLKDALERLAEAAEAAGLEQDERYALTQLTRLAPGDDQYNARLTELGGADEFDPDGLPIFDSVSEPTFTATTSEEYVAPLTATTGDEFVLNSQELAAPVEEAGFEWNPVSEMSEDAKSGSEMAVERGFSFDAIVAEELPSSSAMSSAGAETVEGEPSDALRRQELESVDFYIAQGYGDIALDTLELLEKQSGSHPDIDLRREQIKNLEAGQKPETARPAISHDAVTASDLSKQPTFDEAREPTFVMAPNPVVSEVSEGIDPGLAAIFEEYRASSESEGEAAANGDYETHYNLGLAYKEMDLFVDALEEFQMAANLSAPGDGTPRYFQCCNLLGHCFMRTGVPELAVKWFTKGLNVPGASDDERMALTYEIGVAHEQGGDLHRALESFTEVYGINVSYRNVSEHLRTLKARLGEKNAVDTQTKRHSEQMV